MRTLPVSEAVRTLSALVDSVEGTYERVTITRNGRRVAVLVNPDDLDGLEETLAILSDPEKMQALGESQAALDAGDVVDEEALMNLMARRKA